MTDQEAIRELERMMNRVYALGAIGLDVINSPMYRLLVDLENEAHDG
jgi:hypothetical protein